MRIERAIGKRRDHIVEAELARMLRAIPSEQAFDLIWQYIEREPVMGLIYANRVLRDGKHHERILERGFERANVSTIQYWVELGIRRLGPSRVLTQLETFADKNGRAAAGFLYWTRILLCQADPQRRLRDRFNALRDRLEARGYPEPQPILI